MYETLKLYDELQFEITRLNTDNFLKDQEIERLKQTISEQQEMIEIYENQLLCLKGEKNE